MNYWVTAFNRTTWEEYLSNGLIAGLPAQPQTKNLVREVQPLDLCFLWLKGVGLFGYRLHITPYYTVSAGGPWGKRYPHNSKCAPHFVIHPDRAITPSDLKQLGVKFSPASLQSSLVKISERVARTFLDMFAERHKHSGSCGITEKAERTFSVGQVLSRVYNGKKHSARFTSAGRFRYRGEDYRSLSAVARKITGRRTSGPGFFGV